MAHGGKRKGAGRKPVPSKKIAITKKVQPVIVEYLKDQPNATVALELAILRSKGFRDWHRSREKTSPDS